MKGLKMNVITTSENHCLLACDDLQSDRHIIFLRNMRPLSQRQKIFCEMQAEAAKIYQTAWCLIPQEHNLHSHQCENLKSHTTNSCSCLQPWQVLLSVNTANFH